MPADIQLLNQEPVTQIIDLTTGAHTVLQVNGKYLYKKSATQQALDHEAVGLYLYAQRSTAVPQLISRGSDFIITECLPQASTATQALIRGDITMPQLSVFVASFLAGIFWKWSVEPNCLGPFPFLSWSSRLQDIRFRFKQSRATLVNQLSSEMVKDLAVRLSQLSPNQCQTSLTLVHRDLHTDNILVSLSQGYPRFNIIDMEHCMEGPLEFELQNAILWHDQKSLDIEHIRYLLRYQYQVPYDERLQQQLASLYVADQLSLAASINDLSKINLLASLWQQQLK